MVQGFPEDWDFTGRKTAAYRQVGNAFPPPVAKAVGEKILSALKKKKNGGKPSAVPLLIRNTLKTTV